MAEPCKWPECNRPAEMYSLCATHLIDYATVQVERYAELCNGHPRYRKETRALLERLTKLGLRPEHFTKEPEHG